MIKTYDYIDDKGRKRIGLLLERDGGRLKACVPSLDFEGDELAGEFKMSVGKKNHVILRVVDDNN